MTNTIDRMCFIYLRKQVASGFREEVQQIRFYLHSNVIKDLLDVEDQQKPRENKFHKRNSEENLIFQNLYT